MVKVSVLYPNRAGTKFDLAYYLNHHIPLVRQLLGLALKGVSVEHGISGEEPGPLRMSQPVIFCLTQFKAIKRASARTRRRSSKISRSTRTPSHSFRSGKSNSSHGYNGRMVSEAPKCSGPRGGGLMCTLTVVTGSDTYHMAMNRDEKIARGAGALPEMHEFDGTKAIYPSDGDGGTWFATNEYGIALALLNWNDVAPHGIHAKTRRRGRVIPALIDSRSLWDLHAVFRVAQLESDAGSVPWLRRLHASHAGGPGPFSLCVHREDAKTLSYSEVTVTPGHVQMGHFQGSPCTMTQIHPIEIERADCLDPAV